MAGEAPRFISPPEGIRLFASQLEALPELEEEVIRLSGGRPGVMTGIIARMGDAISEAPEHATTVAYVRNVLEVPEDEAALPGWRSSFWEALKAEKQARSAS